MAITDKKISVIYPGRDISSLSDRPNQDGMTATELKARFDQLGKEIIPKINSLIDELFADLYSGSEQTGHTHNIDNLVDGITYKLFTAVERSKLGAIAEGAEVNQNAFSNVKVGSTTIASTTKTDTFELVAGLNITMTVDSLTKKITFSATGDLATEAVQSYIEDIGNYFTSLNVEGALQEIGANITEIKSQLAQIAINVKKFGAMGDNVDDTLAIMLAVDEALSKKAKLYFPPGIYVIKKSTIEASRPTDIISSSGDYIKTASMTGDNATVVIDGKIGFDTSSVINFECTNLDFELRNGQLTNYDNPVNFVFRNINPTNTSKRLYRDLTFNGIVTVDDGTQRYRGAIAEHCVDSGYFNNLIFKNISICMYLEGQNFTVDSFNAFNFQTGVWASPSNSNNFKIMNITGKNTVAQSQTWLNKTNPTNPLGLKGADLFLGGQDNYSLINLLSVNPIERCIYSQGSNVTARNLKSFNGSGFKFVGRGYTDIVKNIDIDNCELIIDRNVESLLTVHQLYWVDGVNIKNSRLTDMTANGTNKVIGLITLSLYVKNVVLDNISCNAGLGNSLVYVELRTETSLTAQEYLVLENLTLKNSHIYKNNRSLGSLFMQRDVEASADAKLNYCGRNINIKNCHVEYGTTTDDFIYDFSYIDGLHGENNTSNKRVFSSYGIAPYNATIKNNIVLNEVLYYTNEATSIGMLKNVRLSKGSKLIFKRTNAFKADMIVEVTKGTTFEDTSLLDLYDNSKVRYILYSAEYISLTTMFDNYMIEIRTDNGYYLGQVIGATLTNLIRTPPFTITVASINQLTMRGDLYNNNATIEIVNM